MGTRKSSPGNPYHDEKGRFTTKGGCKKKSVLTQDEYDDRTTKRFSVEATDAQKEFAEKIRKSTGVPFKENGTRREYEEYINENYHDYVSATEAQARTIQKLEESLGVKLASDDRYGGNANSYIGHITKAEILLNKDNWEKREDGNIYCATHELKKDGTPGTQNQGYRMIPTKVKDKVRYTLQRGDSHWEESPDGKKHRVYDWHDIDEDDTGLKALVKDDKGAAMKRAALNEMKRYRKFQGQENKGRKREPNNLRRSVRDVQDMGSVDSWNRDDEGGLYFASGWNSDNRYKYVIEEGTTGLHMYREVISVQESRRWNPKTKQMEVVKTPHKRIEWVGTGYKSEEEAVKACQKYEAETLLKQRVDPKAVSEKEFMRWIAKGKIKSKNEYNHILDPVKKIVKG